MRATIQWSYDLLTPAAQTVFRRLAVFTAPFELTAAEAVAGASAITVDITAKACAERLRS